jgi:hypothetical protein
LKYKLHPNTIDLVIGGPDFSGTSTQIEDTIDFFKQNNLKIKDLRGDEFSPLFHAERFKHLGIHHDSLRSFLKDHTLSSMSKLEFMAAAYGLLTGIDQPNGQDLQVASMVKSEKTTYINPNSANVWILEEPPRRTSGQICRVVEHNRSIFNSEENQTSTAMSHQAYRTDEFLRFRKIMREEGKTILRSRSEESACYQIFDEKTLPKGIYMRDYLMLPGNQMAFANPPTHIFIACGPSDWTMEEYADFKRPRAGTRTLDDFEKNIPYQMLVNTRYATDWIDNLYNKGCELQGSTPPKIYKFDMRLPKEEIRRQMHDKLKHMIGVNVQ